MKEKKQIMERKGKIQTHIIQELKAMELAYSSWWEAIAGAWIWSQSGATSLSLSHQPVPKYLHGDLLIMKT